MRYDRAMRLSAMRRSFVRRTFAVLLASAALAALAVLPASAETLRIGGTGSALGMMKLLADEFEKLNPDVAVKIYPSLGSTGAVRGLAEGALDIAITGRQLKLDELKHGLTIFGYAQTPLAAATRTTSSLRGITAQELSRIYSGETTRWPDGRRIRLVLRPAAETDVEIVRSLSPEMSRAMDAAYGRPGMLVAATDRDCSEAIEAADGTLGFITLTQFMTERPRIRLLSLNSVEPTVQNMASGKYPLSKTLYAVTKASPSRTAARFIAFLRSTEARRIIGQTGNRALPSPEGR